MRLLWTQVKDCLPADSYELCTVDERDEGLIFYGVRKMEHLTGKTEPYPSFDRPEHITEEIQELIQKNENVIFLSPKDEKTAGIIEALKKFGISCRVVQLPYHRALLFPQLPQDNKPDGGKI
jgi:ABC-type branched-subunit amino acid transport system substrate-binding protein